MEPRRRWIACVSSSASSAPFVRAASSSASSCSATRLTGRCARARRSAVRGAPIPNRDPEPRPGRSRASPAAAGARIRISRPRHERIRCCAPAALRRGQRRRRGAHAHRRSVRWRSTHSRTRRRGPLRLALGSRSFADRRLAVIVGPLERGNLLVEPAGSFSSPARSAACCFCRSIAPASRCSASLWRLRHSPDTGSPTEALAVAASARLGLDSALFPATADAAIAARCGRVSMSCSRAAGSGRAASERPAQRPRPSPLQSPVQDRPDVVPVQLAVFLPPSDVRW